MIVIAHRLSTVENSDCIYVINKGQVVQVDHFSYILVIFKSGNHKQLMSEDGLYKVLVQRQLMGAESVDTMS